MAAAIVAGLTVAVRLARRSGLSTLEGVYDLAFPVVVAALVGARLYAVLLFLPDYLAEPLEIFKVWHGGLAIHGAIAGGALALVWYCRRRRQPFLAWADLIAVVLPLGQAIGRWGNYFNQELFGPPTSLPWGIPIDPAHRPTAFASATHFHPTFLYESLLNLGLFFVLLFFYRHWYDQRTPMTKANDHTRSHDHGLKTGAIVATYLIGYGAIRLLMEQLRTDPTPAVLALRWPVVVSVGLVAGGVGLLVRSVRHPVRS